MTGSWRTTWTAALAAVALAAVGCGSNGGPKCPAGQTDCGGACVDTATDPNNCVFCGFRCVAGATCTSTGCQCPAGQAPCGGTCVSLSTNANCGACGHLCDLTGTGALGTCGGTPPACACAAPPVLDCGAVSPQCVNGSTDPANCGACGHFCGLGSCAGGACTCTVGPGILDCTSASPQCVNSLTDAKNCGTCGHACAAGQACSQGVCCPAGQTSCSGACADLATDAANCGACGNACGVSESCSAGHCCGTGLAWCGGPLCADTRTDPANCGTCGHACGAGQSCSQGICCAGAVCGATPACCQGATCCSGNVCQPAHGNGLGQTYYDCAPLGVPGNAATYDSAMAGEAAAAWAPAGASQGVVCGTATCVCRTTAASPADSAVWCYTSTLAGYVGHASVPTTACTAICPVITGAVTYPWH